MQMLQMNARNCYFKLQIPIPIGDGVCAVPLEGLGVNSSELPLWIILFDNALVRSVK